MATRVRLAAVQYQLRALASFAEFQTRCEYFVRVSADYRCDFITFPELFTVELLSSEATMLAPLEAIERLTSYTPKIRELFAELAERYKLNIIAGSHLSRQEEPARIGNNCMVFLRDGTEHCQGKIHPTPNERRTWEVSGANRASPILTDCGPIGVLICYDSEFPELARHLVDQGAQLLFVPFCTDDRQGYLRVRYCAQARAVENQVYVVMAGCVGNLAGVHNMAIHYAQSAVLTPCDYGFARDGIAVEAAPHYETMVMAEVDLDLLAQARSSGTVQNLADRRRDLYQVNFAGSQHL